MQGSVQLLESLFKGERGGEIVVVPPGEPIGLTHLFEVTDPPVAGQDTKGE